MNTPSHLLRRRTWLRSISTAALPLLAPGLGRAQARSLTPITIAESDGYGWAVPFVATAEQLWARHGLQATVSHFTAGRLALEALLAGKANFATTTDSPVALAGSRGLKPIVIAQFSQSTQEMVTLARTDRGIASPADLKGKRVATTVGTSGHYYLSRFLGLHGVNLKDVRLVNLRAPEMVTAVVRGDIDAFAWGWDAANQAQEQGAGAVRLLPNTGIEKVFVNHYLLATNEATLKEQPQAVAGALRALLDAEALFRSDFDKVVRIVAERTKTPPDVTRKGLAVSEVGVRLEARLLDDLVANAQWTVEAGLAQAPAGAEPRSVFRSLIHTDTLRGLDARRVTLS